MTGKNKSILVIDDDEVIQELITFYLEKENFKVLQAYNSDEGFSSLKKDKVDLVLCDITMAGMDGVEFCAKVREDENYRALPFIFITASTSLSDKVKALEAGGDDLIHKPFDLFELLLKIQTLLKRSDIYKAYGIKKELSHSFADDQARILLVDDDLSIRKLISHGLLKNGFNCVTAASAKEGLEIARSFHPDLILSDILMPGIDGYGFRKMIAEENSLQDIPFVFLTSKEGEKDILHGYEYNVNDYIVKTSGIKIITAKISAIIKGLTLERKKIIREISTASDALRLRIVPEQPPEHSCFKIDHWHMEYEGIPGGDFLDYIKLNDDSIAIVLGDVMGKKWDAWYFAFAYAAYIRTHFRSVIVNESDPSPGKILKQINKSIYEDSTISEIFAAVSILIIEKNSVTFSGAGDIPIFIKSGSAVQKIYSDGVFLGLTPEGNYIDKEIILTPGSRLFMLTDGILETRNAAGDQYGNRFQELLKSITPGEGSLDRVKEDFFSFSGSRAEDDVTIISLYRDKS